LQEAGAFDGGCADDDVAQSRVKVALNRIEITNAAAELHGNVFAAVLHGFQDAFDGGEILRLAGKGAI
jgi:hypothetical protein